MVLVVLIVTVRVAYSYVQQTRDHMYALQWQYDQEPENALHYGRQRTLLKEQQADVDKIMAFIPTRQGTSEVVGTLESLGVRYGVTLSVPEIKEVEVQDKRGKAIPDSGPLGDVALKITALGEATQLLSLLHALESESYLLKIPTWSVRAQTKLGPGSSLAIPPGAQRLNPRSSATAGAVMEAELIIAIQR